jgi:hypothetical protein
MDNYAPEPLDAENTPAEGTSVAPDVSASAPDANAQPKLFRARIARSRNYKRQLIEGWRENIDRRRGKVYDSDSDDDRVAITYDWSATKDKHAQLFSQVPQVRLKAKKKAFKAAMPTLARKVNDALATGGLGTAMNEVMPDVINAAGFGMVKVAYESRQEMRDLPEKETTAPAAPAEMAPLDADAMQEPGEPGAPVENQEPGEGPQAPPAPPKVTPTPYTTAKRIIMSRVSPSDGLWDLTFSGSNFNRCPWVGETGRMHWSRASKEFKLKPSEKSTVCGTGVKSSYDRLTNDEERDRYVETEMVEYDEIFYWRYLFHDDETSFEAIQRMVFVRGKQEPAINEPWNGQKRLDEVTGKEKEDGTVIVGACLFPIQFLTLTYLSDEAIPPSDTAMGRPQVEELMQGRTDMMLQRRHSRPMRWFNNILVSPEIATALMRGTWQGAIPLNGSGDRAVGEIARASYPQENDMFDRIAKTELQQTWGLSSQGNGGGSNTQIRTAAEANNAQANMTTRVSFERAQVAQLVANVGQIVAGLLCLYGDWDEEETAALGDMSLLHLPGYYTYNIRTDATVLLDSNQRYQRLEQWWNMTAKSGMVDQEGPLQEMASLIDVDEESVKNPPPKPPEPPKVTYSFKGEDLDNPVAVAIMIASGTLPNAQAIEAAKQAILSSKQLPAPPPPPGMPPGGPGGPAGPGGPGAPPPPPGPGAPPPPGPPVPPPHVASPQVDHHPEIDMAGRVNKRMQDGR